MREAKTRVAAIVTRVVRLLSLKEGGKKMGGAAEQEWARQCGKKREEEQSQLGKANEVSTRGLRGVGSRTSARGGHSKIGARSGWDEGDIFAQQERDRVPIRRAWHRLVAPSGETGWVRSENENPKTGMATEVDGCRRARVGWNTNHCFG